MPGRLAPLVVVLASLAAGCGSGGSSSAGSSSKAKTTAKRPSATAAYHAPRAAVPAHDAPPWVAPPDPMARTRAAGLAPEHYETLVNHVHSHLDVFVNGRRVTVPAGIGIDTGDPQVKSGRAYGGPAYGGIAHACQAVCISPLHTHDVTGILHTESPNKKLNTIGEFFTEWGVRLTPTCVGGFCRPKDAIAVFVNGRRWTKDPRDIELANATEIAFVIGSPPGKIPTVADISRA